MSMRGRFIFYFCFLFLPSVAWCADLPVPGDARVSTGVVAEQNQVRETDGRPGVEAPRSACSSELTADLVYAVLVGQIAGQRGAHRIAFTHFLHGARLARDPELVELAAGAALALDDVAAVQQTADVWLDLSPDSIDAHRLAVYARIEADDVAAATGYLRRMIALAAEKGKDGYGQAARLVSELGPPDQRLQLMETLTAEAPESAEAWFAKAVVAASADRREAAVDAAWRASELRPDWNSPRILLVRLLLKQDDRKEARRVLEGFVNERPDNRDLRLLYAQLLIDEQEFSHARSVFEQLLCNAPREPDILFALGILSLRLEDPEAARGYFMRLHDTGKRRGDSAYYLGQVEEQADNPEPAVSWYREVAGERALDAQVRIALIRAEQGKVARAREILQQLRDRWPENASMIYLIEGATLADLDRPDATMEVYDEALAAFPDDHDLLYARGLHTLSLNRLDIMESDFKAILAEDPEHADALNALGYSLADHTERFAEALSYIERALALKPDDSAVLDSMGWVQFRLGNSEQALDYLRRALALMPDGEIAAHLGEVLWTLGRHDEARNTWEAALDQDPNHEYLLRVLDRHKFTRSTPSPR